jgi:DNA-binding GntR family transcriptional regulator
MVTIVDFIYTDLKSRLQSGRLPPESLTLQTLAKHYDVSMTPVRSAIDRLIDCGWIIKNEQHRLRINDAKINSCHAIPQVDPAMSAKLPDQVERDIERHVIQQSMLGTADFLREDATADAFEIGRTTLRRIFIRLAGEGFLEHRPRCGWRVRPFQSEEVAAYLIVRKNLELKALDLAAGSMQMSRLQQLLDNNRPAEEGTQASLDNSLHQYFIDCSRNRFIQHFFQSQGRYFTALFDYAAPEARVVSEMAVQHRNILAALLDDDLASAGDALAAHIVAQQPIVDRAICIFLDQEFSTTTSSSSSSS